MNARRFRRTTTCLIVGIIISASPSLSQQLFSERDNYRPDDPILPRTFSDSDKQGSLRSDRLATFQTSGFYGQYTENSLFQKQVSQEVLPAIDERIPSGALVASASELARYRAFDTELLRGKRSIEPLIADYEVSSDLTSHTFTLRRGLHWSDGYPITTEDFRFASEEILWYLRGVGESTESSAPHAYISVKDSLTFSLEFPKPYSLEQDTAGWSLLSPYPAHFLKPMHPLYNSGPSYEQHGIHNLLAHARHNPALPVYYPWTPEVTLAGAVEWRSNPYYPVVDEDGRQVAFAPSEHARDLLNEYAGHSQESVLLSAASGLAHARAELESAQTGEPYAPLPPSLMQDLKALELLLADIWPRLPEVPRTKWYPCVLQVNRLLGSSGGTTSGSVADSAQLLEDIVSVGPCTELMTEPPTGSHSPAVEDPLSCDTCLRVGGFAPESLLSAARPAPPTEDPGEFRDLLTDASKTRLALSTVIVLAKSRWGSVLPCTGTHLGGGLILTAGHCIVAKLTIVPYEQWTVLFGCDTTETPRDKKSCIAVEARPVERLVPYLQRNLKHGADVGVLTASAVPEGFEDWRLPLDGSIMETDAPLRAAVLIEVPGTIDVKGYEDFGGKALISDSECRVMEGECKPKYPITDAVKHGCDTQRGSSGGPILTPTGGVIGMHLAGHQGEGSMVQGLMTGTANCYMPTKTVLSYLRGILATEDRAQLELINGDAER